MSNCKYIYRGHTFNSEIELDNFLIGKGKYLERYGDSIFQREDKNTLNNNTIISEIVPKTLKLRKEYFNAPKINIDGEEIVLVPKPYAGVLEYLGQVVIDGTRLYPEFTPDYTEDGIKGYWPRRVDHWTGKVTQEEDGKPKWTDDEIELFFNGDKEKAENTTLSITDTDTILLYRLLMTKKWEQLAKFGTAIHAVLHYLFSPDPKLSRGNNVPRIYYLNNLSSATAIKNIWTEVNLGRIPKDGLTEEKVGLIVLYAKNLFNTIKKSVCKDADIYDCDFYSELPVSARLTTSVDSDKKYILGMIDLLVVDNLGNIHIFDFKTSPKVYDLYDTVKKNTFTYLLLTYQHILNAGGVITTGSTINVLPILLFGFKLNNPDDAFDLTKVGDSYKGIDNAEFSYERIQYEYDEDHNINELIKPLNDRLARSPQIDANISTFLPHFKLKEIAITKILNNVTNDLKRWFSGNEALEWTDEGIIELIKEKKADIPGEDGKYRFRSGIYFMKELVADSEPELIKMIKKESNKQEARLENVITTTVLAIDKSIERESAEGFLIPVKVHEKKGTLEWAENIFDRYCNKNWKRRVGQSFDTLLHNYGLIVLQNVVTGLLDFIKISTKNLKDTRIFGKGMKRKYLTGSFQTDELVESDTNNRALPAAQGFVEIMEVMHIINNIASSLDPEHFVGRILVVNPTHGLGISATNEQIRWNYDKLLEHYGLNEGEADLITVQKPAIKFLKGYELAYLMLNETINSRSLTLAFNGNIAKSHMNALDLAIANGNKEVAIELLLLIADKMVQNYGYLKSIGKGDASEAKCRAIYNQILIGIANLKGIDFKVQIKDHEKWLENKGIKSILEGGFTGTYIDNPGNLSSETLNLITKLVTEAYQLVRQDMVEPKTQIRKLLTALKKDKHYTKLSAVTGNWRSLYGNMFRLDITDDLVFVNPYTANLSEAEKEFLIFAIKEILLHKPGNTSTEEEIESMMKNNVYSVFLVPLAKGEANAQVAEYGIILGFKNRLKHYDPRQWRQNLIKYYNNIMAESTGDFLGLPQDANISDGDSTLFEMNNMFDLGNSPDTRQLVLKKHNIHYFEHDLETLLLKYEYSHVLKKRINDVFPTIKAAMIYLATSGWQQNTNFENDLQYMEDYINANIKNKNIWAKTDDLKKVAALQMLIKKIASFMTLAFSPVLFTYLSFQGLLQTISLYLRKPDGTKYSFSTFMKAFGIVYNDLISIKEPTLCQLINELYSINDMDMNVYAEHLKQDLTGFTHFAYKFASRPDYYNRMWIIVMKMIEDGSFDALSVKDGKLDYDMSRDTRYSKFLRNDKSDLAEYNKQKALYLANYRLFKAEGMSLPELDLNNPKPLPLPYTNQEMESIKSICDLIYGYYTHEKKSMVHNLLLGSMFMLMRTYWSGKKNLYLAPGGVKLLGQFELATNDKGELLYYQVIDGVIREDLPLTTTVTEAPFFQWKGKFQEGIILTLAIESQLAKENIRNHGLIEGTSRTLSEIVHPEKEDWAAYYRRLNLGLLGYDVIAYLLFGHFIAASLKARSNELKKMTKESNDIGEALLASLAYIGYRTVSNAASDFNFVDGVLSPLTVSMTPFSILWYANLGTNLLTTVFGDRTIIQGLAKTMSATKLFMPVFDVISNELHGQ